MSRLAFRVAAAVVGVALLAVYLTAALFVADLLRAVWAARPDLPVLLALLAAGVFGALSGLLGEVTQRMFYSHSGTHVDPPAMAIAIMMLLVGILGILGVLPNAGYL
ncbi:hypothetical protein DJ71_12830 [Halorubrum sp. E3]|nr:hypothetical protein DJ71_12830 [Halorubrum sp. E3]